MCKYKLCGTNLESNSVCTQCGEPKCDDCASASLSRVHKSCNPSDDNGNGPKGPEPQVHPVCVCPKPQVQPRPAGIINDPDGKTCDRIL